MPPAPFVRRLLPGLAGLVVDNESPVLWWLAGLTSVADWIGSDENFFPANRGVVEMDVATIARRAITTIGFAAPEVMAGLSFHDLFHDDQQPDRQFIPNEMQLRAISTITEPGVYVIEAPMGTGKTEAALGASYQLLADEKSSRHLFRFADTGDQQPNAPAHGGVRPTHCARDRWQPDHPWQFLAVGARA